MAAIQLRRLDRADKKAVEFQVVIQDITARKKAEIALQDAKAALEKVNQQLRVAALEARNKRGRSQAQTAASSARANFWPT